MEEHFDMNAQPSPPSEGDFVSDTVETIELQWSGKPDGQFIISRWIFPHGRSKFPTIGWQSDCNFNLPGISQWTRKCPRIVADSSCELLDSSHGQITQCILKTTCGIIQRGLKSFEIKIIKEFQIMKGPLNVDNPIISKLDGHKTWAIIFL